MPVIIIIIIIIMKGGSVTFFQIIMESRINNTPQPLDLFS